METGCIVNIFPTIIFTKKV